MSVRDRVNRCQCAGREKGGFRLLRLEGCFLTEQASGARSLDAPNKSSQVGVAIPHGDALKWRCEKLEGEKRAERRYIRRGCAKVLQEAMKKDGRIQMGCQRRDPPSPWELCGQEKENACRVHCHACCGKKGLNKMLR